MFNADTLVASLIWGSIGMGFLIYGKKQKEWVPAFGGLALIITSYFAASAMWMSVLSVAFIAATFWLRNRF